MTSNKTTDFLRLFPDERLSGKIDLRKAQLVMLRMLKIFDYLCRKNNIDYWVNFGTLLGAVRHKGFIPWDADLDVGMTRKSYNKFVETGVPQLPNDVFFQNSKTDPYYPGKNIIEAKLRDKYSNYIEWQEQNPNSKWHNGIQLDIFVYDKWLSKNESIFKIQRKLIIYSLLFNKLLKFFYKLIKVKHYAVPERVVFFNEDDLFPLKTLEFEGVLVMAPKNYEKYLQKLFGDYMKFPPENERYPHEGKIDVFNPCNHKEILYWDKDAPNLVPFLKR
jgi:lipopolysaccharide cholinephosphotransferase